MRDNLVWVFAGTRKTGKTTKIKQVIKSSLMRKVLIVDTFDSQIWRTMEHHGYPEGINEPIPIIEEKNLKYWNSGTYRIFSKDMKQTLRNIEEYVSNTLVIFEDAKRYAKKNLTSAVESMVIDSKQKNNDLIFVYHMLKQVPTDVAGLCDLITILKTNERYKSSSDKFPDLRIEQAMNQLRKSKNRFDQITIRLT